MKTKFLLQALFLLIFSSSMFAQKPITPDVDRLNLHLSHYRDFDAHTKKLLSIGYKKIDWTIAKSDDWLQNSTYEITSDTIQTIVEIIHGKGKEVFKVNMYYGYTPEKWATFSDARKIQTAESLFFNVWEMVSKQFEDKTKAQRIVFGTYKVTDYDNPKIYLKGLDDGDLGFFCYWGPFMKHPVELHSYNARLIKVTVADPEAMTAYYTATKK